MPQAQTICPHISMKISEINLHRLLLNKLHYFLANSKGISQ